MTTVQRDAWQERRNAAAPAVQATARPAAATNLVARHWLAVTNGVWGALSILPWLAPLLMRAGVTGAGRLIYWVYGFLCHQLADRSFFLFGRRAMYAYPELVPGLSGGALRDGLRAFIGSEALGYKVAWSARMVALYGGVLLGGLMYALLRGKVRRLSWRGAALLLVPLLVDGLTHAASDLLFGLEGGWRYDNAWLAALSGYRLPWEFVRGNALGSFNSWMRLGSGLLAGLAGAWAVYPLIDIYLGGLRARSPASPND